MTAAVDRKGRVDLVLDTLILDALDELLGACAAGSRSASPLTAPG